MIGGMHHDEKCLWLPVPDKIDRHMRSRDSQLQLARFQAKALIFWLHHKLVFR